MKEFLLSLLFIYLGIKFLELLYYLFKDNIDKF